MMRWEMSPFLCNMFLIGSLLNNRLKYGTMMIIIAIMINLFNGMTVVKNASPKKQK